MGETLYRLQVTLELSCDKHGCTRERRFSGPEGFLDDLLDRGRKAGWSLGKKRTLCPAHRRRVTGTKTANK